MVKLRDLLAQLGELASYSVTPHIVVVGSTMVDLVVYSDALPADGETIIGHRFALGHGGKGANQAAMASRLGAKVTFINRSVTMSSVK
jgi:pfkB family carbohydrate kinase